MTDYVLDTNALLRYLLNDITDQAQDVAQLFEKVKRKEITVSIPAAVFLEAVFTLSKFYDLQKDAIGEQLFAVASNPILTIEKREIIKKALLIWKTEGVSFVDCLVLAEASFHGKTLFTFDQRLRRLSKRFAIDSK